MLKKTRNSGFTLIEAMVVLTIIVMLAGVAIVNIPKYIMRRKVAALLVMAEELKAATLAYRESTFFPGFFPNFFAPASTISSGLVPSGRGTDYFAWETALLAEGLIEKFPAVDRGYAQANILDAPVWDVSTKRFLVSSLDPCPEGYFHSFTFRPLPIPPVKVRGRTYSRNSELLAIMNTSVPVTLARALSLAVDGKDDTAADNDSADTTGAVVYTAPTGGNVSLTWYVAEL